MKRVPCSGCSLLCDDIIVRTDGLFIDEVFGACLKGKDRFVQISSPNRITSPMIRKNGELVRVNWEEALEYTVRLLEKSVKPLLYGFSTVTCETQYLGMELAKLLNGYIDSNASICQGKVFDNLSETGINLTTLTEVINKADLIILWGANPAETIPRLLNKALFSRGKFRMTGREIKTLIIIDPVKTASFQVMGVRDLALLIDPNKDIELIRSLKEECCNTNSIPEKGIAGIDQSDLRRLLLHLTGAENGVIFIGQALLQPNKNYSLIKELLELLQLINEKQTKGRISLILLGGHFNMMGFDQVALSNFGVFGSLEFKGNQLNEEKVSLLSKLEKDDFDCSVIVGSDPISHLPFKASSKLAKNPIILIDNKISSTYHLAEVILPTAISGIESNGLAYRFDQVPIELMKIVNPPSNIPSDEDLLLNLITKLHNKGVK
ncbi:MAG: formylmethanofuran dehydrogenase subunit B [Candidatus Thorarchaeota archaeon]